MASFLRSAAIAVVFYVGMLAWSPSPKTTAEEPVIIRVPAGESSRPQKSSESQKDEDDDSEIYTV